MKFYNSSTIITNSNNSDFYSALAITCIVILAMASFIGTCGNVLILVVVAETKELRQTQSIFIVNLALSDMYVTMIADPMSIVGK